MSFLNVLKNTELRTGAVKLLNTAYCGNDRRFFSLVSHLQYIIFHKNAFDLIL